MGLKENNVWNLCRIKCGSFLIPLYRNNSGACWQSNKKIVKKNKMGKVESVTLLNPQWVQYGLKVGSGDGIGPAPIVITQEHVGMTIAAFMSVETKAASKPSPEQLKWRDDINARGGIAVIAHSPEDVPDPQKWQFPRAKNTQ